jgi:hypothetical protein
LTADARFKIIVTDGVFSREGIVAQVDKICNLAESESSGKSGRLWGLSEKPAFCNPRISEESIF